MKFYIKKQLREGLDKMSQIDLKSYYKQHSNNKEWLQILSRFPEELQREFIDERPNGDSEDISELKSLSLNGNAPISVNTTNLLNGNNLKALQNLPQEVIQIINKNWNMDIQPGQVYDQNPQRYMQYAKMPATSAKPSVLVNGEIYFGVARFVAALLRGDKTMQVWDLKS